MTLYLNCMLVKFVTRIIIPSFLDAKERADNKSQKLQSEHDYLTIEYKIMRFYA